MKIRDVIRLRVVRRIMKLPDDWGRRIEAGYQLIGNHMTAEELLFLASVPAEVYVNQGININISMDNSKNLFDSKLEAVSQLLNRILLSESGRFTYQDQVYIATLLRKLGIYDTALFLKRTHAAMREYRNTDHILAVYEKYGDSLKKIVDQFHTESRQEKVETEPVLSYHTSQTSAGTLNLFQKIYERLDFGHLCHFVSVCSKDPVQGMQRFAHDEFCMTQYERLARELSLMAFKGELLKKDQIFSDCFINPYEREFPAQGGNIRERTLSQMSAALLLNLIGQAYSSRLEEYRSGHQHWLDFTYAVSQTAGDTLDRFAYFHSAKTVQLGPDSMDQQQADHSRQEEERLMRQLISYINRLEKQAENSAEVLIRKRSDWTKSVIDTLRETVNILESGRNSLMQQTEASITDYHGNTLNTQSTLPEKMKWGMEIQMRLDNAGQVLKDQVRGGNAAGLSEEIIDRFFTVKQTFLEKVLPPDSQVRKSIGIASAQPEDGREDGAELSNVVLPTEKSEKILNQERIFPEVFPQMDDAAMKPLEWVSIIINDIRTLEREIREQKRIENEISMDRVKLVNQILITVSRLENLNDMRMARWLENLNDMRMARWLGNPADMRPAGRLEDPSDMGIASRLEDPADMRIASRLEDPADMRIAGRLEDPADMRIVSQPKNPAEFRIAEDFMRMAGSGSGKTIPMSEMNSETLSDTESLNLFLPLEDEAAQQDISEIDNTEQSELYMAKSSKVYTEQTDLESVKQYLDDVNAQNVRRYEAVLKNMSAQKHLSKNRLEPDMQRTREEALKALDHQEEVISQIQRLPAATKEERIADAQVTMLLQEADYTTRYIFDQISRYHVQDTAEIESSVRPVSVLQFMKGIAQYYAGSPEDDYVEDAKDKKTRLQFLSEKTDGEDAGLPIQHKELLNGAIGMQNRGGDVPGTTAKIPDGNSEPANRSAEMQMRFERPEDDSAEIWDRVEQQTGITAKVQFGIEKLTDRYREVQDEVRKLTEKDREVQNEVGKPTDRYKEVQDEVRELTERYGKVKGGVGNLTSRYREVQEEAGELTNRYREVQEEAGELTERYGEVKGGVGNLTSRYREVEEEAGELTNRYREVQEEAGELTNRYREVQEEAGELTDRYREVQEEAGELTDRYREVQDGVRELTDRYREVQERGGKPTGRYAEIRDKIGELTDEYGEIQSQLKKVTVGSMGTQADRVDTIFENVGTQIEMGPPGFESAEMQVRRGDPEFESVGTQIKKETSEFEYARKQIIKEPSEFISAESRTRNENVKPQVIYHKPVTYSMQIQNQYTATTDRTAESIKIYHAFRRLAGGYAQMRTRMENLTVKASELRIRYENPKGIKADIWTGVDNLSLENTDMILKQPDQKIGTNMQEVLAKNLEIQIRKEVISKIREVSVTQDTNHSQAVKQGNVMDEKGVERMIEKGILKQTGEITEKVYRKLEKKLESERARRGR